MINGTDSGSYPPLTEKYQTLTIYNSDICRSVNLYYVRDAKYEGIPGYRYETKDDYLNEMGPEYSNECFCVNKIRNIIAKKNGCLLNGALDLSTCLGEFFLNYYVIKGLPHSENAMHLIWNQILTIFKMNKRLFR